MIWLLPASVAVLGALLLGRLVLTLRIDRLRDEMADIRIAEAQEDYQALVARLRDERRTRHEDQAIALAMGEMGPM